MSISYTCKAFSIVFDPGRYYDLISATFGVVGVLVLAIGLYYSVVIIYYQHHGLAEYRYLAVATYYIGFHIFFVALMMIGIGGFPPVVRWAQTVRSAVRDLIFRPPSDLR